jgi:hypothetical protein
MNWSKLNKQQLGKYGEYLVKMEFTKYGFDVYTAEVDNKGIDFVIRNGKDKFFKIQVKSIRGTSYVYMRKEVFKPQDNLYLALLIFRDNSDLSFLIVPSLDWLHKRYEFLVDRNYIGKKSKPEFGININKSNLEKLRLGYSISKRIINFR